MNTILPDLQALLAHCMKGYHVSADSAPGSDVDLLRSVLAQLGYNSGKFDRDIRDFQRAAGITVDGYAGKQTVSKVIAAWEAFTPPTAPQSLHARHKANLSSQTFRSAAYKAGRAKASPACGAVAAQYYLALGVLPKWHWVYATAQALADVLECKTLAAVAAVEKHYEVKPGGLGIKQPPGLTRHPVTERMPGDLVVCADLNGNKRTDHVVHYLAPRDPKTFHAVDNQHIAPYVRNVAKGTPPGKTPAVYVLRLPGGTP